MVADKMDEAKDKVVSKNETASVDRAQGLPANGELADEALDDVSGGVIKGKTSTLTNGSYNSQGIWVPNS